MTDFDSVYSEMDLMYHPTEMNSRNISPELWLSVLPSPSPSPPPPFPPSVIVSPTCEFDTTDLKCLRLHQDKFGVNTPEPSPSRSVSIESSNFDVFLTPREADEPRLCLVQGNQVGNMRFLVLLSLFRQKYLKAAERGDKEECESIAQELMDTVTRKCVPKGRFYEQLRDVEWKALELSPTAAVAFIRGALQEGLHSVEGYQKVACPRPASMGSGVSLDDEDKAVAMLNRFDVICDADSLQIKEDCCHTGNNRLKVMLTMRVECYKKSNLARKQEIVAEVVTSITDDACSKFLRADEPSGLFKSLSRVAAAVCVRNSLDAFAYGDERRIRNSEVKMLMARRKKKAVLGRIERLTGRNSCQSPSPCCSSTIIDT
jgi:hypothetical protein